MNFLCLMIAFYYYAHSWNNNNFRESKWEIICHKNPITSITCRRLTRIEINANKNPIHCSSSTRWSDLRNWAGFLNKLYRLGRCYGFIEGTRPFGMEFDKRRINWNVPFHIEAVCNENRPFSHFRLRIRWQL